MTAPTRQARSWGEFLVGAAVPLNVGLHVWLTPMHLEEQFYVGVLFCIGNAALLVAVALLLTPRAAPVGWLLLAATGAAEFVLFVASRTVGLPSGYLESWTGEPEDILGLISLASDLALVGATLLCVRLQRVGTGVSLFEPGASGGRLTLQWRPPRLRIGHPIRGTEGRAHQ